MQEPESEVILNPYDVWKADPTPDNMAGVVKSVEPVIGGVLSSMNGNSDTRLKAQARLYAAEAIQSYNPDHGASLNTWVGNSLQRMRRFNRETGGPLKVTDRTVLDAYTLSQREAEYEDQHGDLPDVKTLADLSGMSVKRIADVRRASRKISVGDGINEDTREAVVSETDTMSEALEYIYDESDPTDRKIIERLTGFGGHEILDKAKIAKQLSMDPATVTRRSARISMKIQKLNADLEELNNQGGGNL